MILSELIAHLEDILAITDRDLVASDEERFKLVGKLELLDYIKGLENEDDTE